MDKSEKKLDKKVKALTNDDLVNVVGGNSEMKVIDYSEAILKGLYFGGWVKPTKPKGSIGN